MGCQLCLAVFSVFSPLFAETAAKFSEVSRVTDFRNSGQSFCICRLSPLSHAGKGRLRNSHAKNAATKEITENACLSLQTVKKHLHSVFRKLQVPSRTRLVALAS
jgi:hypothetical protein